MAAPERPAAPGAAPEVLRVIDDHSLVGEVATPPEPSGLRVTEELRGLDAAFEAADFLRGEFFAQGDRFDVVLTGSGDPTDRIVARCATGDLAHKQNVAIALALNFVRSLLASASQPPVEEGTHACMACPVEVRDLHACAKNAVTAMEMALSGSGDFSRALRKVGDLKRSAERFQPIVDAHFAAQDRKAGQ